MPANLNALIRYKTINSCLYGGRRKWTIDELINACSEALAESRGRYEPVSERTIRDDIRVMRSDILGFNAPIMQQKGLYYYTDNAYSIMTISITDSGLLEQIISFLESIRSELNHPELETIIDRLSKVIVKKQVRKIIAGEQEADLISPRHKRVRVPDKPKRGKAVKKPVQTIETELRHGPPTQFDSLMSFTISPDNGTTWGDVLKLI
jgi:hypothetical protein